MEAERCPLAHGQGGALEVKYFLSHTLTRRQAVGVLIGLCFGLTVLVGFVGYFLLVPRLSNILLGYSGHVVAVEPVEVTARGPPGTVADVAFGVRNLTKQPVRLVGISTSCGCMLVEGVPALVPPKGFAELKLRVRIPAGGYADNSRYSVQLFIDRPSPPVFIYVALKTS